MVNEPIENYKTGFISIFRSIKKHWIWEDPIKFKWWIDILLGVNYTDNTVNIGYQLFECKRGQSVKSLTNWAKDWSVDKNTVYRFFELLKKDKMITTENLQKTIRLTVCNYESYQQNSNANETQTKRKRNANETQRDTNNKDNKDNNIIDRQKIFETEVLSFEKEYPFEMLKDFFRYWSEPTSDNKKMKKDLQNTWDTKRRLITWFKNQQKFNK